MLFNLKKFFKGKEVIILSKTAGPTGNSKQVFQHLRGSGFDPQHCKELILMELAVSNFLVSQHVGPIAFGTKVIIRGINPRRERRAMSVESLSRQEWMKHLWRGVLRGKGFRGTALGGCRGSEQIPDCQDQSHTSDFLLLSCSRKVLQRSSQKAFSSQAIKVGSCTLWKTYWNPLIQPWRAGEHT